MPLSGYLLKNPGYVHTVLNAVTLPAIPAMSAVWTDWGNAITLAMQDPTANAADLAKLAGDSIREAAAGE